MVPSGSVTPLAVSDAVGADEVVEAATGEIVAVSTTSTELVASEVVTSTPGEVVGIVTEAAEVLTAATPTEEVARRAELDLVLALHADFLDEVMVELEK